MPGQTATSTDWGYVAVAIGGAVSALAAAVAAVFSWLSARASRDLVDIERQRWDADRAGAARARLRAVVAFVSSSPRVSVINDGPADALDVRMVVVRRETGVAEHGFDNPFRAVLKPGDLVSSRSNTGMNVMQDPGYDVDVTWRDDGGDRTERLPAVYTEPHREPMTRRPFDR